MLCLESLSAITVTIIAHQSISLLFRIVAFSVHIHHSLIPCLCCTGYSHLLFMGVWSSLWVSLSFATVTRILLTYLPSKWCFGPLSFIFGSLSLTSFVTGARLTKSSLLPVIRGCVINFWFEFCPSLERSFFGSFLSHFIREWGKADEIVVVAR